MEVEEKFDGKDDCRDDEKIDKKVGKFIAKLMAKLMENLMLDFMAKTDLNTNGKYLKPNWKMNLNCFSNIITE